jgi:cardiolipin synthase
MHEPTPTGHAPARDAPETPSEARAIRLAARRRRASRLRRGRIPRHVRRRYEPPIARTLRPEPLVNAWWHVRRAFWWPPLWLGLTLVAIFFERTGWAIGAASMAAFCYLTHAAERAPQYGLERGVPVSSAEFTDSLSGLAGAPYQPGNRLAILNNGDAFYPAMLQAIAAARRSITMEAYIYWDGDIGRTFAHALAERARAGVPVKLLLDAVGSSTIGGEILAELGSAGCQLAWFRPVRWYTVDRVNNRTHRKSLIVDGGVAFTGGAGIADHWCGRAEDPDHWRDLMVRLEGPAVVPLQTGFAQNWLETTGELVSGAAFFPPVPPVGEVVVQTVLSSPSTGASAARLTYFFALACAERSVIIANPYFVPDPVALKLFADAVRRGVIVEIVVSGIHNDNWLARHNSRRLFGKLIGVGARVFEYNRTMLHHKTMVVDSTWATVGTSNFDNRSFAHNEESNVCFTDPALVGHLEELLHEDLLRAEPVNLAGWRRRGLVARSQEVVASLLEHQV